MARADHTHDAHSAAAPGTTAAAAGGTPSIALQGFTFTQRTGILDWRLLHGIDVDAVVRETDVRTLEDCLPTLQHGCLAADHGLSSKNCIQLLRVLQLTLEYVWHLRDAHLYLDTGAAFLAGCMAGGDVGPAALSAMDDARAKLDAADRHYNATLDTLEAEDTAARLFHFRRQRSELNWQALCAVDLDAMMAQAHTAALDKVLPNLVFGSIGAEDREALTRTHFDHLIPLAQCGLDYLLAQARATGAELERRMGELQAVCGDIPGLTAATQQVHTRITDFLAEAQAQAAAVLGLQASGTVVGFTPAAAASSSPVRLPSGLPHTASPASLNVAAAASQQLLRSGLALAGPRPGSPAEQPGVRRQLGFGWAGRTTQAPLPSAYPYTRTAQAGMAAGAAMYASMGLAPALWGNMPPLPSQGPLQALGMGGYGPPGALAKQWASTGNVAAAHVCDMHVRMEALETDIRLERSKTDEVRRMLLDIRDRMTPPGAAAGVAGAGMSASSPLLHADSAAALDSAQQQLPLPQLESGATREGRVRTPAKGRGRGGHRVTQSQSALNIDGMDGTEGVSVASALDSGVSKLTPKSRTGSVPVLGRGHRRTPSKQSIGVAVTPSIGATRMAPEPSVPLPQPPAWTAAAVQGLSGDMEGGS